MDRESKQKERKTEETMMDVNIHFDAGDVPPWYDSLLLDDVRDKQPKKKEE